MNDMTNTTSTCRVGLLGSDLSLSLAKVVHEREAAELGLDYDYRVMDVSTDPDLADVRTTLGILKSEGYRGVNITHPFKRSVLDALDEFSEDASQLGAANTVVFEDSRSIGHNTDWYGFARSVEVLLGSVPRRKVLQLGAGGAGMAVAHALLRSGVEDLTLLGRDPHRTRRAEQALTRMHPDANVRSAMMSDLGGVIGSVDGIVNTTPIGMPAHPGSPVPAEMLRSDLWVHDIVYMPLETRLMRDAGEAGCLTVGGEHMFVYQAAENLRLFTGVDPDPERMLAHLMEIIASPAGHGEHPA